MDYKTVILPVVLYGCETWSLTLREEYRLRVFENRVLRIFGPKKDEVTGGWRNLHSEELHNSSSDWLRAGRPRGRSSSPGRVKNFLFSTSARPPLGSTQPPIQWVLGALSSGVKRPAREADHSPPASAESRKCGSIHPLLHKPSWHSA
jgi:hypothetical protein